MSDINQNHLFNPMFYKKMPERTVQKRLRPRTKADTYDKLCRHGKHQGQYKKVMPASNRHFNYFTTKLTNRPGT